MEYITTTQLRTQSSDLVKQLTSGIKVILLHRSKVVGAIIPQNNETKTFDYLGFADFIAENIPSKKTNQKVREATYKKHMLEKYG